MREIWSHGSLGNPGYQRPSIMDKDPGYQKFLYLRRLEAKLGVGRDQLLFPGTGRQEKGMVRRQISLSHTCHCNPRTRLWGCFRQLQKDHLIGDHQAIPMETIVCMAGRGKKGDYF